jgi:hypothetical protein
LQLAREKAILEQTERDIAHDLSAAIAEVERAYATSQTNYNRRRAAREQLGAFDERFQRADQREQTQLLDLLLDAQRRFADADASYFRSLLEYALAVKNVHYQKGSLLEFNDVFLAEGPWPGRAYRDAMVRERTKHPPAPILNYIITAPPPVSRGEVEQTLAPADYVEQKPWPGPFHGEPANEHLPPENQPMQNPQPVLMAPVDQADYAQPLPPVDSATFWPEG